jgi:oxygen-independent coproporphyrinogen-3 oxidase
MGYTDVHSNMLIGLGVSAISDIGVAYAQNHKELELYYRSLEMDELPVTKGHFMDDIDIAFKQYILQTICKGKTRLKPGHKELLNIYTLPMLKEMEKDGLLELSSDELKVTKTGFQFVRNICKAFDIKWLSTENSPAAFSKAV